MANSNTEHSKKLRAKTAAEWQKKQLEEGKIKRLGMTLPTEIAEAFNSVSEKMALSKPQTLKALIDFYNQHHQ